MWHPGGAGYSATPCGAEEDRIRAPRWGQRSAGPSQTLRRASASAHAGERGSASIQADGVAGVGTRKEGIGMIG